MVRWWRPISAPICSSAISVWSRVAAFSTTSVFALGKQAREQDTADFTCALATGIS